MTAAKKHATPKCEVPPEPDNIIENFYYFHPTFKGYKIIGAIAGKVFPQHLQEKALKKGYTVITQKGDHIEQKVA